MKKLLAGAAVLALCPSAAMAVGLDRSGQPVDILFEDGNYFELSFGRVFPSLEGEDRALAPFYAGGTAIDDVGEDFNQLGAGVKFQVAEKLSFALIADKPYGVDINYPGDGGGFAPSGLPAPFPPFLPVPPTEEGSANLGGTYADVDSSALTAMGRYEFNDNFSVHGGLRYQRLEARVGLSGFAYGPFLSGYTADFDRDYALGYAVGAAYERPDIALRVAVTYFSEIEHELDTTETTPGGSIRTSVTEITTPQAINLDFQTGLNQRTLLFGQIRYAWYEDVTVAPPYFDENSDPGIDGTSLTEIADGYSLAIGVGRALTDRLSGSVTFGYERAEDDDLVSPLAPTNGQRSIGLGLSYDVTDSFTVAGGVRYVALGDASPETGTPDTARADFSDNHAVGLGLQIGYRF
ncbi:Long-chain fatty acid transport protein [Palleronia marisminoris]|uniref:Outer membrane protein transport protein (OMPP1/FadL/TodX) n=1 Tax=Palleronia marisminoris TaxID=315423 RepID=A0A1Y5RC85_9RHOB|nr:outer membrane protein transport protein [Palleronia marisminoris]SFG07747.1 Long-chain fatty acid transport protein [Palleronia marisminoris]SLN11285.1 Outer membrane protein transport protein (OMPP1/FadL/TodX) [Palleronia marisminoris]